MKAHNSKAFVSKAHGTNKIFGGLLVRITLLTNNATDSRLIKRKRRTHIDTLLAVAHLNFKLTHYRYQITRYFKISGVRAGAISVSSSRFVALTTF